MNVQYSSEQLETIKSITEFAGKFADHFQKIMCDTGLDQVDGCRFEIRIIPKLTHMMKQIIFGTPEKPAGFITLIRGRDDEKYYPIGKNSAEYEILFAEPELAERMRQAIERNKKKEKELPPDGLCISAYDDYLLLVDRGDLK